MRLTLLSADCFDRNSRLLRLSASRWMWKPDKEPAQPVGEIAADEKQVLRAQLREQPLHALAGIDLQVVDELQCVLVMDGENEGRGRGLPEQIADSGVAEERTSGRSLRVPLANFGAKTMCSVFVMPAVALGVDGAR